MRSTFVIPTEVFVQNIKSRDLEQFKKFINYVCKSHSEKEYTYLLFNVLTG